MIARGDHGPVSDRVGIGNPHLDQMRAPIHQLGDQKAPSSPGQGPPPLQTASGPGGFLYGDGEKCIDAVHSRQ